MNEYAKKKKSRCCGNFLKLLKGKFCSFGQDAQHFKHMSHNKTLTQCMQIISVD